LHGLLVLYIYIYFYHKANSNNINQSENLDRNVVSRAYTWQNTGNLSSYHIFIIPSFWTDSYTVNTL